MKHLLKYLRRNLLRRAIPHGLVSWRYLLPSHPPQLRIHLRLWLLGRDQRLPLPLYLLMELFLWLRWVAFACWWQSWHAVRLRGDEIREREDISKGYQIWRLLSLGLGHCIPPREIYAFGLYRPTAGRFIWDYVYLHETSAYHGWRSSCLPDRAVSMALVQDKSGLAKLLSGHNIPMAPVMELIPRSTPFDPASQLLAYPRLFCKPRHGSASRDNFVIEQQSSGEPPAIYAVINGMKSLATDFDKLHKAMEQDDFLVQPKLTNHPELAPLSATEDAITVRIITELDSSGASCYSATLEIPGKTDCAGYYHTILPIDQTTGALLPFPAGQLPARARAGHNAILAHFGHSTLPHWHELRASALAAHQFLPGLFAIAWDYVITPDGPVMLEGNSGWGVTVPQLLNGGLLQAMVTDDR